MDQEDISKAALAAIVLILIFKLIKIVLLGRLLKKLLFKQNIRKLLDSMYVFTIYKICGNEYALSAASKVLRIFSGLAVAEYITSSHEEEEER